MTCFRSQIPRVNRSSKNISRMADSSARYPAIKALMIRFFGQLEHDDWVKYQHHQLHRRVPARAESRYTPDKIAAQVLKMREMLVPQIRTQISTPTTSCTSAWYEAFPDSMGLGYVLISISDTSGTSENDRVHIGAQHSITPSLSLRSTWLWSQKCSGISDRPFWYSLWCCSCVLWLLAFGLCNSKPVIRT